MLWTVLVSRFLFVQRMEVTQQLDGQNCSLLTLMALNQLQPAWVPKLTEVGFQVAPIPEDVFSALTSEHRQLQSRMVKEGCAKAVINCEEIVINHEDGEEFLRDKRQTFIMNPRYLLRRIHFNVKAQSKTLA